MTGLSSPSVAADHFRYVIGHFASGVSVVTSRCDGQLHGATVSSISSVSLEPPMLLACMNRQSTTCQAVHASRSFAVNVLAEQQRSIAARFAGTGGQKFLGLDLVDAAGTDPWLPAALAHLQCRVVDEIRHGSHAIFVAEVQAAAARPGSPLAYYRGSFGSLDLTEHERGATDQARDPQRPPGGASRPPDRGAPGPEETVLRALQGRCAVQRAAAELTLDGRRGDDVGPAARRLAERAASLLREPRPDPAAQLDLLERCHVDLIRLAGSEHLVAAYRSFLLSPPPLTGCASLSLEPVLRAYASRSRVAADTAIQQHYRELTGLYAVGIAPGQPGPGAPAVSGTVRETVGLLL